MARRARELPEAAVLEGLSRRDDDDDARAATRQTNDAIRTTSATSHRGAMRGAPCPEAHAQRPASAVVSRKRRRAAWPIGGTRVDAPSSSSLPPDARMGPHGMEAASVCALERIGGSAVSTPSCGERVGVGC